MNEFELHVRGNMSGKDVHRIRPVFVWKSPSHLTQFTVEMSKDPEFEDIVFLRDTHERYWIYDSAELMPQTVYYVRVRSGMGKWSKTCFTTGM